MSAASYYDKSATQEEQPGPMHSGTQGYGQDMRQGMNEQQQQRGFNQQGYNEPSGNGIYSGQEPKMGNTNYAQGAQQMNGNGDYAQGAQQMNGNGNYAQGAQQMNGNGNYAQGAQHMNGNNNYAHGAQQMEGQGAQGDVADDRDTLTKLLDRIEKKFGGDRFNNPENAEKNKALNANILKRVKQVMGMVMQRGPGMLMRMVK